MISELKKRSTESAVQTTQARTAKVGGRADRIRVLIADDHVTVLEGLAAT
jgi:hypothetical protein